MDTQTRNCIMEKAVEAVNKYNRDKNLDSFGGYAHLWKLDPDTIGFEGGPPTRQYRIGHSESGLPNLCGECIDVPESELLKTKP